MDMFLKHSSFLQPALCQRNNNRKVAITLLFSSHFQMIEITGLLQPELFTLRCNATWSPTKAICLWVRIWMWKGSKASCVTFLKWSLWVWGFFRLRENAKIIVSLNSYVEKLTQVWVSRMHVQSLRTNTVQMSVVYSPLHIKSEKNICKR